MQMLLLLSFITVVFSDLIATDWMIRTDIGQYLLLA